MDTKTLASSRSFPQGTAPRSTPFRYEVLVLLGLVWAVSLIVLVYPAFDENTLLKAFFLVPPFILSLLVVLLNPYQGFAIWSIGLAFLVTQTGFQLQIGRFTTSALEVVLVLLLLLLFLLQRSHPDLIGGELPGKRYFGFFFLYSLVMLAVSLLQGTRPEIALVPFKGFLLYPLMAYILMAGLRTEKIIWWSVAFIVFWFAIIAGRGILQYISGSGGGAQLYRSNGEYGPINLFGISLSSISLLVVGVAISTKQTLPRLFYFGVAGYLFLGGVTSGARSIWIAFGLGLLFLLVFSRRGKWYLPVLAFLAVAALVYLIPQSLAARITNLYDSSTENRIFLLVSGLYAWKARWLTGWGWGRAFYYYALGFTTRRYDWTWITTPTLSSGLIPTNNYPWYHNDFLNLAVQVGLIGLSLFLLFWGTNVIRALKWYRLNISSPTSGVVLGSTAALVCLLVSANFEHIFWRPDMAGLAAWLLGLLLAGMYIHPPQEAV